jgi:signal transduction histidine kinase
MKISSKLLFAVFVPLLVTVVVGVALIFSYRTLETVQDKGDKVRLIRNSITELNQLVFSYIIYREERPKQQYRAEYEKMTALLASLRFHNPDQQQLLNEILVSSQFLKDAFGRLVANTEHLDPAGMDKMIKYAEGRLVGQLLIRSRNADSIASTLRSLVDADIRKTRKRTIIFVYLVMGLMIIPVTIVLIQMRKRITTALIKLRNGSEIISSGNLNYVLTGEANDEIGDLTQAFNRMTANLKEVTSSRTDLEREIVKRKRAEEKTQELLAALEVRVQERTAELAQRNEELTIEIAERLKMEQALTESKEQLRILASKILSAQENERKRIASEVHDVLGSSLSAIKFKAEEALLHFPKNEILNISKPLEALVPLIKDTIEEARRIQADLRPPLLDDLGIVVTLSWFCRRFETIYSGIEVEQAVTIREEEVPDHLKIVLFRIIQEAMNNIVKHAKAESVYLGLQKVGGVIELCIKDNGNGFDPASLSSREISKKGLGLSSMKERIEFSGGIFTINSVKGKGTVIRAAWPV